MGMFSKYLKYATTAAYAVGVVILTLYAYDYVMHFGSDKAKSESYVPTLKAKPEDIIYSQAYVNQSGKDEVRYAYKTDVIPPDEGEIIERRTPNSKTYHVRDFQDEKGKYKQEVKTTFLAGDPQFFKDGEEWRQVEYATTTPENLVASGAQYYIKKRELIEWLLPGEPAFALTGTYYPDPDAETSSVDGAIFYNSMNDTWANVVNATAGNSVSDNASTYVVEATLYGFYDWYPSIQRAFLLFDTSALPDGAVISAATLDVYVSSVTNGDNDGTDTLNLITTTPASNTGLVTGDYDQVGSTLQASALDISSLTTSADNTFTLNGTGQGNISKTGVTKFGIREGHDLGNTSVDYSTGNSVTIYAAEQTGTTNDPTLTVTYINDTTAPTPNPATFSTAPYNAADGWIVAVATTGTDADGSTPIEYIFYEATGSCGANHGTGAGTVGWQTSSTGAWSSLQTNKCYSFTTQMRDSLGNTGTVSSASMTYTNAAVPGAVAVTSITSSTAVINNAENGNPTSNPATTFAVYISATNPTHSTWNGKYVDSSGNPSATAVWLTDSQLTNLTLNSLQGNTEYTIASKARNADNDETSYGSTTNFVTSFAVSSKTVKLLKGTRLKDGVRLY